MIEIIALTLAILALILVMIALMLGAGNSRRLAHVEALIENGINREDLDKLQDRIGVLVEKVGGLSATVQSQHAQISRIDSYLRSAPAHTQQK